MPLTRVCAVVFALFLFRIFNKPINNNLYSHRQAIETDTGTKAKSISLLVTQTYTHTHAQNNAYEVSFKICVLVDVVYTALANITQTF